MLSIDSFPQKSTQQRDRLVQVFGQSVRGAFAPINAALKELNRIKVCELSDAEQHKFERLRRELEAFRERLAKIYTAAADLPDWADYIVQHVLRLKDEFDIVRPGYEPAA